MKVRVKVRVRVRVGVRVRVLGSRDECEIAICAVRVQIARG